MYVQYNTTLILLLINKNNVFRASLYCGRQKVIVTYDLAFILLFQFQLYSFHMTAGSFLTDRPKEKVKIMKHKSGYQEQRLLWPEKNMFWSLVHNSLSSVSLHRHSTSYITVCRSLFLLPPLLLPLFLSVLHLAYTLHNSHPSFRNT